MFWGLSLIYWGLKISLTSTLSLIFWSPYIMTQPLTTPTPNIVQKEASEGKELYELEEKTIIKYLET